MISRSNFNLDDVFYERGDKENQNQSGTIFF